CGLEPGQDIEIKYTGIRPGEKLYEELFSGREEMVATCHERIFISKKELDQIYSGINNSIYTRFMNAAPDNEAIINLIAGLIPEYQKPQHSTISQMKAKAGPAAYMQEAHDQRKLGS
ncbi:MAG: polysaccharide biosynthesis protein, partial [Syntrophomonas sp.]